MIKPLSLPQQSEGYTSALLRRGTAGADCYPEESYKPCGGLVPGKILGRHCNKMGSATQESLPQETDPTDTLDFQSLGH